MGLQAEYVRRGEEINPNLFDNGTQGPYPDGYNFIVIDLAEIDNGTFFPSSGNDAVVFAEAQLLAVSTSGDISGAGAMIRRATYFVDAGTGLFIARQEHDRIRGGSSTDMTTGYGGGPNYTTKPFSPYAQTATPVTAAPSYAGSAFPVQIGVRDAADIGTQDVSKNSMSSTVPDISWPLRSCEFATQGGPNGLSCIKLTWAIYKKAANTYSVSWEIKLKAYRP